MITIYALIFLVCCVLSSVPVFLCFCCVSALKKDYAFPRMALTLWLSAIPLLAAVMIALTFVWPSGSRTYISPDGHHQLRLTIYWPLIYMDVARLRGTLTDMESGETLGKISPRLRDVFIVGWPDSEWADKIISVRWQEDSQDIVHVVVTDMNTVYRLPSGKKDFPIPSSSSSISDEVDHGSETFRKLENPLEVQP